MENNSIHKQTKFLTGLKGYAALFVFFIHSKGGGIYKLSPIMNEIVDISKYAIVVFFLVSAFTIANSIDKKQKNKTYTFQNYLLRRIIRIFPLLFFISLIAFLLGGSKGYFDIFETKNTLVNFIVEISMINIFLIKHRNNLIGVEWTIALEFFYYLLIPILLIFIKKIENKKIVLLLTGILCLSISLFSLRINNKIFLIVNGINWSNELVKRLMKEEIFNLKFLWYFDHWGFLKYLFVYFLGIYLYLIVRKKYQINCRRKINIAIVATIILGFTFTLISPVFKEIIIAIWMFFLIFLAFQKNDIIKKIFENKVIINIGKMSYSFYLTHFLVLNLLGNMNIVIRFFLALFLTILISIVTYNLIEVKFGKIATKLILK